MNASPKKILVFFPHNPYPAASGAHQRCLSLIQGFRELGDEVTLLSSALFTDNPWQLESVEYLQKQLGIQVEIHPNWQSDIAFVKQLPPPIQGVPDWRTYTPPGLQVYFQHVFEQRSPDVVLINYAFWGELPLGAPFSSAIKVMDSIDLISLNYQMKYALEAELRKINAIAEFQSSPAFDQDFFVRLQLDAVPKEYEIYSQYDYTVAVSLQEARRIKRRAKQTQAVYLPLAFAPVWLKNTYSEPPLFVIGNNLFNLQGYAYFVIKVLPLIWQQNPNFCLRVIGKGCKNLFSAPGMQLLGFVEDLKPFYEQSRFAICPLLGGTGQQTKIVEAMAHGLPVILLQNIAGSSPVQHGMNGLIAKNAYEFAEYVIRLSSDVALCRRLGEAARATIAADFSQARLVEKLATLTIPEKTSPLDSVISLRQDIKQNSPMVKIIIDGVFFQLYSTGIARLWGSLLQEWSRSNLADYVLVLDREGTAPKIAGIRYQSVPAYDYQNTMRDREMLQKICDQEQATLFISTYYTTPISTPSVFMGYDMIPERLGAELDHSMWREKHYAIQHAIAHIAISESTARDLVKYFPYLNLEAITVAPCGISNLFKPADAQEIAAFKQTHQITKPYFLTVGAREGYKNTRLFFQAFSKLPNRQDYSIVCAGGRTELEAEFRPCVAESEMHLLRLSDEALRLAYAGAIALVYPSKYEGFGLPILEAMACGCPVITCANASIPEVAGQAALYVGDADVDGLTAALSNIQKPGLRQALIKTGLQQAQQFSWLRMAKTMGEALMQTAIRVVKAQPQTAPSAAIATPTPAQTPQLPSQATPTPTTHPPLTPETADYYQNLGKTLLAEYRLEEAIQTLEQLQTVRPRDPKALQDLGTAYQVKADDCRMKADFYLGFALYRQGKWREAAARYQAFLKTPQTGVAPELVQRVYKCLGDAYQRTGQYTEAIALYREGITRFPTESRLHFGLVCALRDTGQTKAAIAAATEALKILPDDVSLQFSQQLTLPILYDSPQEIDRWRERFTQGLATVVAQVSLATPEAKQSALNAIGLYANFYLAYQGKDDRALQEQYGQLAHEIMVANYPQWVQPRAMPPLSPGGKIRVGYISDCLRHHTVGKLFLGWVQQSDREQFEVYCYALNREQDGVVQQLQRYSHAFYQLSASDLEQIVQQILADQLHVLVFLDFGMQPKITQVASLRLAPVQCVTWGHPVTSGLPTIDYFLSSDLMEPENGATHYSEQLVRLPNLSIAYAKPMLPELPKQRADFGLRDDAIIYLSCQSLFKYLPQYDFVFAAIARQVPQAQFVFIEHFSAEVTEQFRQRLRRAFAEVGLDTDEFCVILPRQGQTNYWNLNWVADIFLDTFSWSGGNTTLEAIACNLPVVTCPGEFMRGRHSSAILQQLGVTETIATTPADYIEIAVKLGIDPEWRSQLVQQMVQQQDQLFGDTASVKGLESFYRQIVSQ